MVQTFTPVSGSPALGYAVHSATDKLAPFSFTRRPVGANDVAIAIEYCGVCHTDLHQARNDWGNAVYPMVPGHEIVGTVTAVGDSVTSFQAGDKVGVGFLVGSCRTCASCAEGLENYCEKGWVATFNGEQDGSQTFGGYSNRIVVAQDFVLKIAPKLAALGLDRVAPLLCAGITTYSPLRHWQVGPGSKVGVVGLGGVGHMAVKFARAFGAHVTVFTTSPGKRDDALKLGAHAVAVSSDPAQMAAVAGQLDFILDTVAAVHDLAPYTQALNRDGTLVLVGVPEKLPEMNPMAMIMKRQAIAGSLIGGIKETQEMLDYCAEHEILADIERIGVDEIEASYQRMLKGDIKYRFVVDMATLNR